MLAAALDPIYRGKNTTATTTSTKTTTATTTTTAAATITITTTHVVGELIVGEMEGEEEEEDGKLEVVKWRRHSVGVVPAFQLRRCLAGPMRGKSMKAASSEEPPNDSAASQSEMPIWLMSPISL